MRVLFDYHELLGIVEDGVAALRDGTTDGEKATHRENIKKDKKAFFIHQGLNDEVFEKIAGATTTKQAWDILLTTYKGAERVKKVRLQTLRHQYETLQMESSESVANYVSRLLVLTNQMKIYGEEQKEQAKVEKILLSLNTEFEHIVVAIEEAHDLSSMTVDELSGSLQAHEQRMNEKKAKKPIEQAFQAHVSVSGDASKKAGSSRGRGRGRGGQFWNNRNRGGYNNSGGATDRDDSQGRPYSSRQHFTRGRGRGRSNVRFNNEQNAHYVQDTDENNHALMVTTTSEASDYHTWYLNTHRLYQPYVWKKRVIL